MAYLVLARKYRPQSFADMTGQEHVVKTLDHALRSGRVAHALLFCGPRGCGKTTTARIVAKALNCEKGPTPSPCGECAPCREIAAGTDVDVQEIDAASNTGVDSVRELRESAKYLPARDRFKIFIVDEVHMLSKAAFNAFLKTLEEPPGHVKFLFATTDPQALPDTILSRCQRHNFRLVPLKQITARLADIAAREGVEVDEGALALVARQAAGSMRDALSVLDQLFSAVPSPIRETDAAQALGALDRGVVSALVDSLLRRDPAGILQGVARVHEGGHDLKRLAEDLAAHLRDLLAARVEGAPLDLPDHELKALQVQAGSAEPAELARLFELVHGSLFDIARASQPRNALEISLLKAVYLAPAASVQQLLARADELARRVGAGGGGGGGSSGGGPLPRREAPRLASAAAAPLRASAAVQDEAPSSYRAPAAASLPPAAPVRSSPAPAAPTSSSAAAPWMRHLDGGGSSEKEPSRPSSPASAASPFSPPPDRSPPPRPVPDAGKPLSPEEGVSDLAQRWPALVGTVRGRKPRLGSVLEHARPLSSREGELRLGFLRGDLYAGQVAEEQSQIEAILGEALGHPVRIQLVELSAEEGAKVASLSESLDQADQAARAERLKEGREHPAVLRAVTLLGAEIEDVRDLGGVSR